MIWISVLFCKIIQASQSRQYRVNAKRVSKGAMDFCVILFFGNEKTDYEFYFYLAKSRLAFQLKSWSPDVHQTIELNYTPSPGSHNVYNISYMLFGYFFPINFLNF